MMSATPPRASRGRRQPPERRGARRLSLLLRSFASVVSFFALRGRSCKLLSHALNGFSLKRASRSMPNRFSKKRFFPVRVSKVRPIKGDPLGDHFGPFLDLPKGHVGAPFWTILGGPFWTLFDLLEVHDVCYPAGGVGGERREGGASRPSDAEQDACLCFFALSPLLFPSSLCAGAPASCLATL